MYVREGAMWEGREGVSCQPHHNSTKQLRYPPSSSSSHAHLKECWSHYLCQEAILHKAQNTTTHNLWSNLKREREGEKGRAYHN